MEDQTSPAQLRESFRGVAADKASTVLRRSTNAMLKHVVSRMLRNLTCA